MADERLADAFGDAPSNWGKWGEEDELGAVNYLTEAEVLRGVRAVEHGRTFSLGVPIGREAGDPMTPGRPSTQHYMRRDRGHYEAGKVEGDAREGAEDVLVMAVHGTTHVDALGHSWYGDALYNGFDPETTKGGLDRCSVEPVAEHGVVGRGVLLDVARHRGVEHLARGSQIPLSELRACADEQGVELEPHDVPVIRTGWLERFYDDGEADPPYDEPGITYSVELAEWFQDMGIPAFATDTLASEQTHSEMGLRLPLHATFIRDQGVLFTEIALLDDLADDCAADGKYDFLYVCSPLRIVGGTGSPVNPLAIK